MSFQINLVNQAYKVHRNRLNAAVIAGAAVAVYLGFVIANLLHQGGIEPLRSQLSNAESELGIAKANLEKAVAGSKTQQQPSKQLIDEVKRLEARLELQRELLVALETGGIGNTEGFSKYLTALARRRVEGVWLTGIQVTAQDGQVGLVGRMTDLELLPVYIRELKNDETLRGQGFAALDLSTIAVDVPSPNAAAAVKAGKAGAASTTKVNLVQFKLGAGGGEGRDR